MARHRKINPESLPRLDHVKNSYDIFDLPFLKREGDKVMNGEFDVSDAPKKLIGVPTGFEETRLTDYLVNRPVPEELIKWRDIPNVHQDSLDMEAWYNELVEYALNGVWVDGEYWNPYMIYWLNIFVFPVPVMDEDGEPTEDFETSHPTYCNVDRYLFDLLWKCEIQRKDFSLMGGRGIGKSYLAGCVMDREYRLFSGSWTVVSSTNEETTNEAWNKVEECLTAIEKKHRALKHKRITDSLSMKYSGEIIELPDGTTEDRGYLSKFEKIIYGKTSGKTRGKRPTKQLVEEFAAFPPSTQKGNLRSCMRESRGSWYVMGGIKKCIVMYTGTGGTVENDEAEEIFCTPKAHNILPTFDWPEGQNKDAKGEMVGTGAFIPTHVKRAYTWEKTGCPDIAKATAMVEAERAEAKHDTESFMGLMTEFPMTIREVFTKRGTNIFNQDKIATQRINIEHGDVNNPKPGRGFLKWKKSESGKIIGIEWDPSPMGDIHILEHPHWLSEAALDDEKEPMNNLYVGGVDSIDQGTMDSSYATDNKKGSELAALIKKRIVDKGYFRTTSNLYVAKYTRRSPDVRTDWDNALKLAYYYNAEMNIEYTKIGIVGYFRDMGFYHLLKRRPTMNLTNADPNKETNLIGTTTGSGIIDHQDQKIAAYIDDYYDNIWFLDLLEQLQNYNRDDRTKFDLVIAMGLCELVDEDLMGKAARPPVKISAGYVPHGYYTDPETGYKKYGIIPQKGSGKKELEESIRLEAEKYKRHGGVRWIDVSDPKNPKAHY